MFKKSYNIVLLCIFLCCNSCTTIENICIRKEQKRYVGNMMEQYKGKTENEIIAALNQPDWTETNERKKRFSHFPKAALLRCKS